MTVNPDDLKRDKGICDAATKGKWKWWTSNSHRRLRLEDGGPDIAYGTKQRDGTDDIVISEANMAAIENAVNRMPTYIAEAEEMGRRMAVIERELANEAATIEDEWDRAHLAGMQRALRIMRGEK